MAEYNIVFDKANGVITAKLRRKCGQSGNWETIYSQDVTNAINMIVALGTSKKEEAQNTIDNKHMVQCCKCGAEVAINKEKYHCKKCFNSITDAQHHV